MKNKSIEINKDYESIKEIFDKQGHDFKPKEFVDKLKNIDYDNWKRMNELVATENKHANPYLVT